MTRRRLSNKAGVEGAVSTKDFSTMARQQAKDVLERSGEYDPKVVNVAFAGHQMDDPATSLLTHRERRRVERSTWKLAPSEGQRLAKMSVKDRLRAKLDAKAHEEGRG